MVVSPLLRQRAFLMPEKEGNMNDIALGLLQRDFIECVASGILFIIVLAVYALLNHLANRQ